jgi:hypothetical protein
VMGVKLTWQSCLYESEQRQHDEHCHCADDCCKPESDTDQDANRRCYPDGGGSASGAQEPLARAGRFSTGAFGVVAYRP